MHVTTEQMFLVFFFFTVFTAIVGCLPMLAIRGMEARGQSALVKTWVVGYALVGGFMWLVYIIFGKFEIANLMVVLGAIYAIMAVLGLMLATLTIPTQIRHEVKMSALVTELGDKLIAALDVDQDGVVSPKDVRAGGERAQRMGISPELVKFLENRIDLVGHEIDDDVSAISASDISTAEARTREKWAKWLTA